MNTFNTENNASWGHDICFLQSEYPEIMEH